MARNESIRNDFWERCDNVELSANARLLYLWSFTNPRCGMSGIYCVARRAMLETGLNDKQIAVALDELQRANLVLYGEQLLLVRSRVKNLHTRGQNIVKAIVKEIAALPSDHRLVREWLVVNQDVPWLTPHLQAFLTPSEDPYQESREESKESVGEPLQGFLTSDIRHQTSDIKEREEGCGEKRKPKPDPDQSADDFPTDLASALDATLLILQRIHDVKGGKEPTRLAVSRVIATYPRRAHVEEARSLESWAIDGNGSRQKGGNIVDRYRNWLSRADDAPMGSALLSVDPRIAGMRQWAASHNPKVIESTATEVVG